MARPRHYPEPISFLYGVGSGFLLFGGTATAMPRSVTLLGAFSSGTGFARAGSVSGFDFSIPAGV